MTEEATETETTETAETTEAADAPAADNAFFAEAFSLGGVTSDDDDDDEDAPADAPPAEVDAEASEEPEGETTEEPAEGKPQDASQKRLDRIMAAARRKEQEGTRALGEAQKLHQQTQAQLQQLQQQQQAMMQQRHALELWATNPAAAIRETAKLVGGDPATMYRNLTERQLADGGIGPHEADDRFAQMQRDFDAKLAAMRQEQEQGAVQQQREAYQRQYKSIVVEHADVEAFGSHWPTLAEMPPSQFEPQLVAAMNEAIERKPHLLASSSKFLDILEKHAADLKSERQKRRDAIRGSADPGDNAESGEGAQAPRDPGSRPAGRKTRSGGRKNPITNATAAEAGVTGKPLSKKAQTELVEDYFLNHELI
jgi:predicted transcriptional regulator